MTSEGDQKERLRAAIAAEEAGLADLEVRRATFERNLEALRQDLIRAESITTRRHPPEPPRASGPLDAAAKVALFGSLFRGREDIFPRLWIKRGAP